MNLVNYTFIIPHRNLSDMLQRCLDSIPCRNDIQIIVVDDNSDASVVDFLNFPGKDRENVEIIYNKVNQGAGFARNLALARAVGKWLVFADCDDFFDKVALDLQLEACLNEDADIIYFKVNHLDGDTLLPLEKDYWLNKEIDKSLLTGDVNFINLRSFAPWGKFIRRSIVEDNQIRFQEVRWSNDVWFSICSAVNARKVVCKDARLYNYLVRQGSLITVKSMEATICRYEVSYRAERLLKEKNLLQYSHKHLTYWWFLVARSHPIWGLKHLGEVVSVYGFKTFARTFLVNVYHHGLNH